MIGSRRASSISPPLLLALAVAVSAGLMLPAHIFAQKPELPSKEAPKSKLRGNELMGGPENYTATKVFGLEARGNKFVYVFDRSGSMGEHKNLPLRKAKEELLASLNDLDEHQQFYIIFYNHEPKLFDPGPTPNRLVFATDDNKQRAKHFVESISADGGTDHVSALTIALRLHPDVIFLLTDGEVQDDPSPEELKKLERMNSGEASINVIQFATAPRSDSALVKLAEENRGKHVLVDTSKLGEHSSAADGTK